MQEADVNKIHQSHVTYMIITVCYYHVYLNFQMNSECPLLGIYGNYSIFKTQKHEKIIYSLKHTNTKVLTRKQLRSVVGSGIPMAMLMCKSSVEGEAPTLISFQGCDDAGQFKDRSGIFVREEMQCTLKHAKVLLFYFVLL